MWGVRVRRGLGAVLVGAGVVLALAGCFRSEVVLTVQGDTVSGTVVMTYHRQVLASTGTTEDAMIANNRTKLPPGPGVSTERYASGNYVGTRSRLDRVTLADFRAQNGAVPYVVIDHDTRAGTYRVSGSMDFTGLTGVGPELQPLLPEFAVTVAITFPGPVISHNGRLSGRTVTWRPKVGERVTFAALARDQPPATTAPPSATAPATGPPAETAPAVATSQVPPDKPVAIETRPAADRARLVTVAGALTVLLAAAGFAFALAVRRRRHPVAVAPRPSSDVENPGRFG